MKRTLISFLALSLIMPLSLAGCGGSSSSGPSEHYVSSTVKGEEQKINLEEVKKAFWETQGKDFNGWMAALEKRINEIYEGKEVVSLDASRETGKLAVTGYIEKNDKSGYQDGEEKLFTIEQTGDVTNNELPYRVAGHDGQPYYAGHHSILDSPFVQMMVLSHLMGGWGGRYYTPYPQTVILRDHRDGFRGSPAYTSQKSTNQDFSSRYKRNLSGSGLASKKGFGNDSYSTTGATTKRSWGFFNKSTSSTSTTKPSFGWGGRRSFGGSRGWGGRRR